jgi:8-oxo-dGTP pyrophosphatase MutT (NUDIX family)
MIPDWLRPVQEAAATISAGQLSRYVPPPGSEPRAGAVLMLFGQQRDLILTERSHTMRSHPGQISFPGGSVDPGDTGPVDTALREAREEIGLDPAGVEVFGELPQLWLPPSNFAVTTVLGWWEQECEVSALDPGEVHAVLRVPIDTLLDPQNRVTTVHPVGRMGPGFLLGDQLILWGFTAGIVSRLFDAVGWTIPWDSEATHPVEDWMIFGKSGNRTGSLPTEMPEPNTDFEEGPGR